MNEFAFPPNDGDPVSTSNHARREAEDLHRLLD
jgi:hypothetical protein